MGGPEDGKYLIITAQDPKVLVGVDGDGGPDATVVIGGKNYVFTVQKSEEGKYTLVLEDGGPLVFIQDNGPKLIANDTPPPTDWAIEGPEFGPYTISVPPPKWFHWKWTAASHEAKSPVILQLSDEVKPEHQWYFIPWPGPEEGAASDKATKPL